MKDDKIDPKYEDSMKELGRFIEKKLTVDGGKKVGFCLILFEFGAANAGRVNYLSNAQRKDIAPLLMEMSARFSGTPSAEGHA